MLLRKQLPAFQTVSAGKVNSCFIPDGVKVHSIWLRAGDDNGLEVPSGDLLGDITIKAFRNPQRTASAIQLNQINSLRGSQYALCTSGVAGDAAFRSYLPFWFSTPWVEPRRDGNALGWNLAPGTGLQLDVEIVAGVANPVLDGWYYYSPLEGALGAIERWERNNLQSVGSAPEHSAKSFPNRGLLQSCHLFPTSDGKYVSNVKLLRNGQVLVDEITHLQNQAALLGMGLSPDTVPVPRYDLMFDDEDPQDLGIALNGLNEFTMKTTLNAASAGTMDVVSVIVDKPTGAP